MYADKPTVELILIWGRGAKCGRSDGRYPKLDSLYMPKPAIEGKQGFLKNSFPIQTKKGANRPACDHTFLYLGGICLIARDEYHSNQGNSQARLITL